MEIWINPACSKCRAATSSLDAAGIEYTVRRYLDEPPTRAELVDVLDRMGLEPWDDPHNVDPVYARVRVRHQALPALEKALGPGVAEALARTAGMLRDDADALDDLAARAYADLEAGEDCRGAALRLEGLAELPRAVRTRVLRMAAIKAGSPPGTLAAVHVDAVDRLVTAWHGQRHVDLPGGLRAYRRYGKLLFGPV